MPCAGSFRFIFELRMENGEWRIGFSSIIIGSFFLISTGASSSSGSSFGGWFTTMRISLIGL